MKGYVVRNRSTGALLGIPKPGGLREVAYWETESAARRAVTTRVARGDIRTATEWDVIPLRRFTQ